jgi:hypothetical protein
MERRGGSRRRWTRSAAAAVSGWALLMLSHPVWAQTLPVVLENSIRRNVAPKQAVSEGFGSRIAVRTGDT